MSTSSTWQDAEHFTDSGLHQLAAPSWRREVDGTPLVLLATSRTNGKWMLPMGWAMAEKVLKGLRGRHSTRRTSTEFSSKIGPDGNKQGNLARLRRRPATWAVRLHPRPVDECSEDIGGVITTDLFAFLTEPNDVVNSVHPDSMPVILTTPDEIETWLTAPCGQARKLQRPLPAGILRTVSVGNKKPLNQSRR